MCCSIEFKGKIRFNRRPFHKHFFFSSKQIVRISWWRHQMETFSALLALRVGNSPVSGEIPAQRPVTRSVDVFFDLRLIKRLSKHWRCWWFETLSRPLWRHCNVIEISLIFFPIRNYWFRQWLVACWASVISQFTNICVIRTHCDNGTPQDNVRSNLVKSNMFSFEKFHLRLLGFTGVVTVINPRHKSRLGLGEVKGNVKVMADGIRVRFRF